MDTKKSVVMVVNTGTEETLAGITFPSGVPVVVYRDSTLYGDSEAVGKLIGFLADGYFVGISFNGTPNTPDESIETVNFLNNQYSSIKELPSYSFAYHWNKATCVDMLDGLQKQLGQFDFSDPSVTVSRLAVIRKADYTISCLAAGFLYDATEEIKSIVPDGDTEFLSAARMAQFVSLFESAEAVE